MKRAFGVVCIICVIYLTALLIGFYKYALNEQKEIEQILLSYALDFSTDGAMNEALSAAREEALKKIGTTSDEDIKIDPNLALDSFLDIFSLSYDLGRSKEAKNYIAQNYIPAVFISGFNGYYIAKLQPIKNETNIIYPKEKNLENSKWGLAFGPKLPYTYTTADNKKYALNMGMSYFYDSSRVKHEGLVPGLQNREDGIIEINKIISRKISETINYANSINQNKESTFFLPPKFSSYSGINPIKRPSMIVLVQNFDLRTGKPISGYSISKSRFETDRFVLAYRRSGIKYYAYSDYAPDSKLVDGGAFKVYRSIDEAVSEGYNCDLKYMIK